MNGILVSMVANGKATATCDADIAQVFEGIRVGKWRDLVEEIRTKYSQAVSEGRDSKKAVADTKMKLPGVLFSGRFSNRKKPVAEKLRAHSGLLCADLDHLGERISRVQTDLLASPHLAAIFRSPTASGLKAVFLVPADAEKHLASFRAVERHVLTLTGLHIDPGCKDLSRLCFVSYDPDLWINPTTPEEIGVTGEKPEDIRLNTESCISASLNNCIPASLHNKEKNVLANIKARREALEALAAKHPKHPNFIKFYTGLIELRFQAQAHARNDFIVEAVPFLYRCVAPQFVLELVGCFYQCNRALFKDPLEQHLKEANAMLESVAKTYAESLNLEERGIYDALPEHEREAFRICRDLALLPEPERETLTFYLSFNHLADRLGIYPTQAQRIMRQLESYGLVNLVAKGTRRAAGIPGMAGIYKWLLQKEQGGPKP